MRKKHLTIKKYRVIIILCSRNENTKYGRKERCYMCSNTRFCYNFDYSKLRGRIKEKIGTEGKFAIAIGRTQNYLTSVWNGNSFLSQKDVVNSCGVLDIDYDDIGVYFFCEKGSHNEN